MKKKLLSLAIAGIGFLSVSQAQTVMVQNFEGVTPPAIPAGWGATHTGAGNGFVTNNGTAAWAIGTLPAHTNYLFVDEYNHMGNTPAYATSPVFSLVGITGANAYLSYDYFYYKAHLSASPFTAEQAWVDLSTDGGTTYTTIDSVPANTTSDWETKFLSLSSYAGMSNLKLRVGYTDNGGHIIGVAFDNIRVFGEQPNDLALTAVTPVAGDPVTDYKTVGGTVTFGGTAFNMGSTTITTFNAYYQVGAGTPVMVPIPCSIAPLSSYNYTISTAYTVAAVGTQTVTMWVDQSGDPVLSNDTMTTAITGVAFMPTKKLAIEEATGTWCGWCVRGIVYMDSLRELHGNGVSLIAVHNGDPMVVTAYDALISGMIGGFPSVVIDRTVVDDPSNLLADYAQYGSNFGFADITVVPTWTSTSVSAAVTVKPAVDMSGDYRLILVLTEDAVHGTSATWAQHDYYSYTSNNLPLTGQGVNYQDSLNPIPATSMHYQHVARSTNPSTTGAAGVLPATMTASTNYTATLTGTVASTWNENYMHGIVMLLDNSNGHVLNTQNFDITLGVSNVEAGLESLKVYPNPATEATNIMFNLTTSGSVAINVYDATGRVVYNIPAQQMTTGNQKVAIPVTALASGVYNVVISTDNGSVSDRFSVVK